MPKFIWAAVLALVPLAAGAKSVYEIIDVVIAEILDPLTTLFFVAATVLFLYGVIEYVAGAANEEARTTGRRHMIWGLSGLLIMLATKVIIKIFENFFGNI